MYKFPYRFYGRNITDRIFTILFFVLKFLYKVTVIKETASMYIQGYICKDVCIYVYEYASWLNNLALQTILQKKEQAKLCGHQKS